MGGVRRHLLQVALGLACPMLAAAQSPEELRALLDQGDARAAYELGRKAPERLGDPAFDFVFGIAAVHAGRAAEGVLALERFLLQFPDHDTARIELARGYFLIGEHLRAREEFELAASRRPSPEVARVIAEHLEAIRAREAGYKPTATAYVEAAAGFDSNPRAGVDDPLITLPVLGEVSVLESGVRRSDGTGQLGAGFRVTVPFARRVAGFASAQAEVVRYPDTEDFDQESYSATGGVMGQWGRHGWRAGTMQGYQTLGHRGYRRTQGGFADAAFVLDDRYAASVGAQAGRFLYFGANAVRDSEFHSATAGLRRLIASAWRPQVEVSVNAARERNLHARHDLSRDVYGGRLGAAVSPAARWTVAAALHYQQSRYRDPDAVLQVAREDRYAALEASLAWTLTPGLTLRLEYLEARNESNVALYEYRRRTALVRARYDFR